jgi:hypothetical protein
MMQSVAIAPVGALRVCGGFLNGFYATGAKTGFEADGTRYVSIPGAPSRRRDLEVGEAGRATIEFKSPDLPQN